MIISSSVAAGLAGAALLYAFAGPAPAPLAAEETPGTPCIAIAIDRDTGIATSAPCSAGRLLLAEQRQR